METDPPCGMIDTKFFKFIRKAVLMFFQLVPVGRSTAQQDLKPKFFRNASFINTEGNIWKSKVCIVKESLVDAFVSDYEIILKTKKIPGDSSYSLPNVKTAPMPAISSLKEENSKDDQERNNMIMPLSSKATVGKEFEPVTDVICQMQDSEVDNSKSLADPWKEMSQSLEYLDDEYTLVIPTSQENGAKAVVPNLDGKYKEVVSAVRVTPENGYFPKAFLCLLSSACTKHIITEMCDDAQLADKKINMKYHSEPELGTVMSDEKLLKHMNLQYYSMPNICVETVTCKGRAGQHEISNYKKWKSDVKFETFPPVEQQSNVILPKSTKFQQHSKPLVFAEILVDDSQRYTSPKLSAESDIKNYERITLEIPGEIAMYEKHPTRPFDGEKSTLPGEDLIEENAQEEDASSSDPLDLETTPEKASSERRTRVRSLIRWFRKRNRKICKIFICG